MIWEATRLARSRASATPRASATRLNSTLTRNSRSILAASSLDTAERTSAISGLRSSRLSHSDSGHEQPLLPAEVVVHQRGVDAGAAGDVANGGPVVAVGRERLAGGLEDRLAGAAAARPPPCPRHQCAAWPASR